VIRAVIDASIAIKWVIGEAGSVAALSLLDNRRLVAPDLLMPECANILWKKKVRAELSPDEAGLAGELQQSAPSN
jgi:predicted nucleic acid-binding protein